MRRKLNSSRGVYLLEYALVLPLVLTAVVGSMDVVSIARTYLALRNGVQEGLRCAFPSDANCVSVMPPQTVPQQDLFLPPLYSLKSDYDGEARALLLPDYSFPQLQAWTLSSTTYEIEQPLRWGIERPLYPTEGLVAALHIDSFSFSGDLQDANLHGGTSLGSSGGGSVRGSIKECSTESTEDIGAINLSTPSFPYNDFPNINQIDDCVGKIQGTSGHMWDYDCSAADIHSGPRVAFNIKGRGFDNDTNNVRSGHLDINLEEKTRSGDWKLVASLGGQDFESSPNQNFVPRGFSLEERNMFGVERKYEDNFSGPIRLQWGRDYRVTFILRARSRKSGEQTCSGGYDVGWDLESIDIRTERYLPILEDWVSCKDLQPASQVTNVQSCSLDSNAKSEVLASVKNLGPVLQSRQSGEKAGADNQRFLSSCNELKPAPTAIMESLTSPVDILSDYAVTSTAAQCSTDLKRSGTCSTNFGSSAHSIIENNTQYVTYNNDVGASCIIPHNAKLDTVRAFETLQSVGDIPTLKAQDCSFQAGMTAPLDLVPTELRNYRKLVLPAAQRSSTKSIFYTGSSDPIELTAHDVRYNCEEVSVKSTSYSESELDHLQGKEKDELAASLFVGVHSTLGCSAEQALKNEAIRIGMDAESYFKMTKASFVGGNEDLIAADSVDSCMSVRADRSLLASNLRTAISGGPYDVGTIPNGCVVNDVNVCIGIPAGDRLVNVGSGTTLEQNQAVQRAVDTIQTFNPRLQVQNAKSCNGMSDCAEVLLEQSGGVLNNQTVKISAEAYPKLMLPGLGSVRLVYIDSRDTEVGKLVVR